jgi:hypothetical protein
MRRRTTIDTEELRRVADFQDFAEHADLIRAAAIEIDDLTLDPEGYDRLSGPCPSCHGTGHTP